MDTKYFKQAVDEYVKKNGFDSKMPISAHLLSQLLQRAQELKDADRKAATEGATA
jgi:hypothetical protein